VQKQRRGGHGPASERSGPHRRLVPQPPRKPAERLVNLRVCQQRAPGLRACGDKENGARTEKPVQPLQTMGRHILAGAAAVYDRRGLNCSGGLSPPPFFPKNRRS
jgi:hypothetical protein